MRSIVDDLRTRAAAALLVAAVHVSVNAQAHLRASDVVEAPPPGSVQAHKERVQEDMAGGRFKSGRVHRSKKPKSPPPGVSRLALPHWTGSFRVEGVDYPYTVIGGDPAARQATVIPTTIVPYRFVFEDGGGIIDAGSDSVDGISQVSAMLVSPIFQEAPFIAGSTPLGVAQFGDAYMRANFWSRHGGAGSGYHVRLAPTAVAPTQEVRIPPSLGFSVVYNGTTFGFIDSDYLEAVVHASIVALGLSAATLSIHATETTETFDQSGGYSGLHYWADLSAATGDASVVHTFLIADSFPGWLAPSFSGVSVLAHEVVEWMMDPLADNIVPPWQWPGLSRYCQMPVMETADPLELQAGFQVTLNGRDWALPDAAFRSWFASRPVSDAVNGWFSLRGTLARPAEKCAFFETIATWYYPSEAGVTQSRFTSLNNRKQVTGYAVKDGAVSSFVWGNVDPFSPDPTTLDAVVSVPGAVATYAMKINDAGQIVGFYRDARGAAHGFLLSGGQYTAIDVPGAVETEAISINNRALPTIVGDWTDASGGVHGFVLKDGVFRTVDFPSASETALWGVNDAYQVTGRYAPAAGGGIRGFVGRPGALAALEFVDDPTLMTFPGGINNAGIVAGTAVGVTAEPFLYSGTNFVGGIVMDVMYGVNDSGVVAGGVVWGGQLVGAIGVPMPASVFGPGPAAMRSASPVGPAAARSNQ